MDESIFSSPIWRSPNKSSTLNGRGNQTARNHQSPTKMSLTDESAEIAKLKDRIRALEARVAVTDDLEM